MGYSTVYHLEIIEGDKSLLSDFLAGCQDADDALRADGTSREKLKWYEHEAQLVNFSKQHPEAIFRLHGIGEESPDTWHKYFKDGKMQWCPANISFDEYDETKLEQLNE